MRAVLNRAERIVIKVGTRVLVGPDGRPDAKRVSGLVDSISRLRTAGKAVVLVTSGAIGSGVDALGLKRRPKDVSGLQMCASVGQSRLMSLYQRFFGKKGITVGQVLLTHDDLKNRKRHLNARNTMMRLLAAGVVPIVNENDVVAVDEIKLGDNDILAALVCLLVEADVLLLLSTTDGLRRPDAGGKTARVSHAEKVTPQLLALAAGKGSELSTGGMATKLKAVDMALKAGACAVIADGRKKEIIDAVIAGKDEGTFFGMRAGGLLKRLPDRKKWIGFFRKPQGVLVVDEGAAAALVLKGKSLLSVGVVDVEGVFEAGSVVAVRDKSGAGIAQGLVGYSSEELARIKGIPSSRICEILGSAGVEEVIHRDNMVLL